MIAFGTTNTIYLIILRLAIISKYLERKQANTTIKRFDFSTNQG